MKTLLLWALFAGLVSTPIFAHHGNAAFDVGKKLELKGTVTEWVWSNPHCWLKFDVKDESGKTVNWVTETTNSADMMERGWSRLTFKAGDQVTVTLEPVKSGAPVGRLQSVVLPNGKTLGLNYVPR
jgi:hypothetical protein